MKKYNLVHSNSETNNTYEFEELNSKGERIGFTITNCKNPGGKNSLPYLWKKNGFTDRILNTYICIDTYVTDKEGLCKGLYNPQILPDTNKINFKWMLEDTPENIKKLIQAIEKLAFA